MAASSPEEALAILADDERDEPERIEAARALGQHGTIASIAPMLSVLDRSEAGLALEIAAALRSLNAGMVLSRELKLGTDAHRERAGMALLRIAEPRTLGALLEATGDRAEKVRVQVYQAIARLGGPKALEALQGGLRDASADVRCLTANGLAKAGDRSALPGLRAALEVEEDPLACDYLQTAIRKLGGS
ncbi:HEAT repeat domain-containing protein [Planctomycetota bacterium]